jgi:peptidoglycan/LPS O-acetylase OafA/YrhL
VKRDLSYGIYLIHAPLVIAFSVFVFGAMSWWLLAVTVAAVTSVLSYFSRILVEEPALRHKWALSNWINSICFGARGGSKSPVPKGKSRTI